MSICLKHPHRLRRGCALLLGCWTVYMGASYFGDLLNGFQSTSELKGWQLQVAFAAFCMSPLPGRLMRNDMTDRTKSKGDFAATGDMNEYDYSKASIYAILYATYADAGTVTSDLGVPYEFTFNTWGTAPTPGYDSDPQRFGKAAYAALATQPPVAAYQREHGVKHLSIVEIGSGTGAGANLISTEVLRGSKYIAIDMQAQATATCKRKHAHNGHNGKGWQRCVHAPKGINVGSPVLDETGKRMADESVDIVIISETHIAAERIGQEEEAIFAEIYRVLKPDGLFLWGNALPSRVWMVAPAHLAAQGFVQVNAENVTAGAIQARDLDAARVNAYVKSLQERYMIFGLLGKENMCYKTTEMLVKNFYRHPSTALYNTMVSGFDSYYRFAFQKKQRPPVWLN
jgi:ubiquinone/menaquinone biosynthesis C-methylase UbiE